ncbi:MAG: YgjP-like metallopeptidase domain-containing protein [Coriobacteriia bacterium]
MFRDSASSALNSLPEFQIRVSNRARRVRLTVTPRDGLVVVVPHRWRGDPATLVAEKADWARAALATVAERHALLAAGPDALLPHIIELGALGEIWPVEYRTTSSASVRAYAEGTMLVVSGAVDDADACLAALTRWLDRTARERLLPLLAQAAADVGLAYQSARVRSQRTRWGSCSSRATISLNRNLVFLPLPLVRSLMLHELAHTLVMNHSQRFWVALEALDPDTQSHRIQMRAAHDFVPPWADA